MSNERRGGVAGRTQAKMRWRQPKMRRKEPGEFTQNGERDVARQRRTGDEKMRWRCGANRARRKIMSRRSLWNSLKKANLHGAPALEVPR